MNDPSLDFNIQVQDSNENEHMSSGNFNQFNNNENIKDDIEDKPQTQEERDKEIEKLREKYNNYSTGGDFLDSTNPVFDTSNPVSQYLDGTIFDINKSAHPRACIVSVIFKILALVSYFVIGGFVKQFLVVSLLTAIDFWIAKSICGKVLVGLNWWYDNEANSFKYDKIPNFSINKIDYNFFWYSMFGYTGLWAIFSLVNFITIHWFMSLINIAQFVISGTNSYCFYKCTGVKTQDELEQAKVGLFKKASQMVLKSGLFGSG